MSRYFFFAGESSGDLHGGFLMEALSKNDSQFFATGVGGPCMREKGLYCFIPMEHFQVMGFVDVIRALPRLWIYFCRIRKEILNQKPDCVVLIDYPGFNLRLARSLRKLGYKGKIVQYICPTVWAHGKKRIDLLARHYDLLLVIYPFEASYFAHTCLPVYYVGNPLADAIRFYPYQSEWWKKVGLPGDQNLIALFPGSRKGEINYHLAQQLEAAAYLHRHYPHLRFAIACSHESLRQAICEVIKNSPLSAAGNIFIIPPCFRYELMKSCTTALAKSGTVTLELALHLVPTVVHYTLSAINYVFAKYILRLKLKHYCIVNILSGQTVFPELIGKSVLQKTLNDTLLRVHSDESLRRYMQENCEKIKAVLGDLQTHQKAAVEIKELLRC